MLSLLLSAFFFSFFYLLKIQNWINWKWWSYAVFVVVDDHHDHDHHHRTDANEQLNYFFCLCVWLPYVVYRWWWRWLWWDMPIFFLFIVNNILLPLVVLRIFLLPLLYHSIQLFIVQIKWKKKKNMREKQIDKFWWWWWWWFGFKFWFFFLVMSTNVCMCVIRYSYYNKW